MGYIGIIGCLGAGLAAISFCYLLDRWNDRRAARLRLRARVHRIMEVG